MKEQSEPELEKVTKPITARKLGDDFDRAAVGGHGGGAQAGILVHYRGDGFHNRVIRTAHRSRTEVQDGALSGRGRAAGASGKGGCAYCQGSEARNCFFHSVTAPSP